MPMRDFLIKAIIAIAALGGGLVQFVLAAEAIKLARKAGYDSWKVRHSQKIRMLDTKKRTAYWIAVAVTMGAFTAGFMIYGL
jgi:hypothetical protein